MLQKHSVGRAIQGGQKGSWGTHNGRKVQGLPAGVACGPMTTTNSGLQEKLEPCRKLASLDPSSRGAEQVGILAQRSRELV